jgi:large subunit ribosomal protein L22
MKRIRPAPMGRAFRYVRRISHIEIALAERGRSGEELATVVGEQSSGIKASGKPKTKAQARGKAPARGKAKGNKKPEKKFAGTR